VRITKVTKRWRLYKGDGDDLWGNWFYCQGVGRVEIEREEEGRLNDVLGGGDAGVTIRRR
jgi:hypothetical protein